MQYKQTRNGCASFRVFCCVYKFRFYLHPYRMHSESKGLFLLRCPIKSSHLTLILDQSSVCGTRQLRYRQCGCLICRPRHLLAPSLFPPLAAVGCATAATRSVRFICHWQRSLCSPRANQVSTGHLVAPVCGLVPLFRVHCHNQKEHHPSGWCSIWWRLMDSNHRPPACEAGALTS